MEDPTQGGDLRGFAGRSIAERPTKPGGGEQQDRGHRAGPLPSGVYFAPFPYEHLGSHRSVERCLEELDWLRRTQSPASETAAVLIEPVLGEGGYVPAPPAFLRGLRELARLQPWRRLRSGPTVD